MADDESEEAEERTGGNDPRHEVIQEYILRTFKVKFISLYNYHSSVAYHKVK